MRQIRKYFCLMTEFIVILIATSHLSFAEEQVPSLFRAALKITTNKTLDVTVKRQRFIYVKTGLLNTEEQAIQHDELMLNLFEDTTFVAKLDRVETFSGNGVGWVGHLRSIEDSQVILITRNGKMTGNVVLPDTLYKIDNSGNNSLHTIKEINLPKVPPERLLPVPVEPKKNGNYEF